jgi:hypothetical protein
VVPAGGLAPDGSRWIYCRRKFFLPIKVLSRLFRGRLLKTEKARSRGCDRIRSGREVMSEEDGALPLDLAPSKSWRRFLPAWLRSVIWGDSAKKYDAFLSYSWKSDSKVAPVIQSLIQQFLRPFYQSRAKTVFRDLSCLPVGSNLEAELYDRLDRSSHLILLASPEAAASKGMEMEARYWFSRPRNGQVLIIISSGDYQTWEDIREHLVPPAVRDSLQSEPVWASVKDHRARIVANPGDHQLRGELIEDLKQVLLRFYPGRDWGQLRGQERKQRRRLIWVLSVAGLTFLVLTLSAIGFARSAREQLRAVRARELLLQAQNLSRSEPEQVGFAGLLSLEAWLKAPSALALRQVGEALNTLALSRAWSIPIRSEPSLVQVHNNAGLITIVQRDRVETLELTSGKLLRAWMLPEQIVLGRASAEHGGAQALSAAVREDGAVLAYAGDHKVLVFDLHVGMILQVIQYQPGIVSLDIAADTLVVVGSDFRVDGWSLNRGAPTSVISVPPVATMHCPTMMDDNEPTYQIHLARDGKRLGIYTRHCPSRAGVVPMWLTFEPDGRTSPAYQDFHFLAARLDAFVFSTDARSFFGIRDDKIYFGDTNTVPSLNARSLAVSAEGQLVASTALDGIRIWRVPNLAKGPPSPEPLAFLPTAAIGNQIVADLQERTAIGLSGCLIATYSSNNVVSVTDCFRSAVLTRIPVQNPIRSVRLAPGRDLVIIQSASDLTAVELRTATLELDTKGEQINNVIVRNNHILSCAEESLSYWDLMTGQLLRRAQPVKLYRPATREQPPVSYVKINSCAMMADGSVALFKSYAQSVVPDGLSGIIDLRSSDVPRDRISRNPSDMPERTSTMLISQDSRAIGAFDPYHWSPYAPMQPAPLSWHYGAAADLVTANVDGAQVAVVRKAEVRVFDTSTSSTLGNWSEDFHPEEVRFFGDLIELRAGPRSLEREAKTLIRDSTGRLRGSIHVPRYAIVCQLSRGGDYATVCIESEKTKILSDGTESRLMGVRLYRIRDGAFLREPVCCWIPQDRIHPYMSQASNLTYTRFSPDGKRWAALDGQRLVIWNLDNNSQVLALEVTGNTPPAFDMTDKWLAVADGGKLKIYDIRSGRMFEAISPSYEVIDVVWTGPQAILFWGADRIGWRSLWPDPAAALCGGFKTSLSASEWMQYLSEERWRDTCRAWRERNEFWNRLRSWLLL